MSRKNKKPINKKTFNLVYLASGIILYSKKNTYLFP